MGARGGARRAKRGMFARRETATRPKWQNPAEKACNSPFQGLLSPFQGRASDLYDGLRVGVDPGLLLTVYLVAVSEPDRMAG